LSWKPGQIANNTRLRFEIRGNVLLFNMKEEHDYQQQQKVKQGIMGVGDRNIVMSMKI